MAAAGLLCRILTGSSFCLLLRCFRLLLFFLFLGLGLFRFFLRLGSFGLLRLVLRLGLITAAALILLRLGSGFLFRQRRFFHHSFLTVTETDGV